MSCEVIFVVSWRSLYCCILSKFQFLPSRLKILTLITPFRFLLSRISHLAKVVPVFTPFNFFCIVIGGSLVLGTRDVPDYLVMQLLYKKRNQTNNQTVVLTREKRTTLYDVQILTNSLPQSSVLPTHRVQLLLPWTCCDSNVSL